MEIIILILVIWLIILLIRILAPRIRYWAAQRFARYMSKQFGQEMHGQTGKTQEKRHTNKQSTAPTPDEKVDSKTIAKRYFDKDQGEYVEFEDVEEGK